jgi:hypothetical protein
MSSFNIPPKSVDAQKVFSSELTDTDKVLITNVYPELNDTLTAHFHLKNIETSQQIFEIQDAHQKYKKNYAEVANQTFGPLMLAVQSGIQKKEKSVVITIKGSYGSCYTNRTVDTWFGNNIPQSHAIKLFETTMAKLCYKVEYNISDVQYDRDDGDYCGGNNLFVNVSL